VEAEVQEPANLGKVKHAMRRILVCLAVALVAVATAVAARGAGSGSRPTLRLVAKEPLVIKGLAFKHRERVRVTATVNETQRVARVRASYSGSFTATFANVTYDPCSTELVVRAAGARGSTADVKIPQRECPPKL
jgi:hypothetical protein